MQSKESYAPLFILRILVSLWMSDAVLYNDLDSCFDPQTINVTLRLVSRIRGHTLDVSLPLTNVPKSTALGLLEEAAVIDERFRFTVSYIGTPRRYFLQSINGIMPQWKPHRKRAVVWMLRGCTGSRYIFAVDRYVPGNGDVVTFVYERRPFTRSYETLIANFEKPLVLLDCPSPTPINVTLEFTDDVNDLGVVFAVTLTHVPRTNIQGLLQMAADNNSEHLWFTVTFVGREVGYVLKDALEKKHIWRWDDPGTQWEIRDSDGNVLRDGMSYYKPKNNEVVHFVYRSARRD